MSESTEAALNTASDLETIIAELEAPFGDLPEEAIKAARLHKQAMIPRLIALIENATRAVGAGEQLERNGHFFALFLLGEFRAREALPAILQAISLPDEGPFELFGDAIHEALPGVLAALAGEHDLDLVRALIENKTLNHYVRSAAACAPVAMVLPGIRSRDEIVELLRQILRRAIVQEDTEIIDSLINALCDLHPEEAMQEIEEAYAKHLVEEFMVDIQDVRHALSRGRNECLKDLSDQPGIIEDTLEEIRHWAAFSEPKEEDEEEPLKLLTRTPTWPRPLNDSSPSPLEPSRRQERVGRNDPCPCGSGKKFKKCCGR